MRSFTLILQCICASIGGFFFWVAFAGANGTSNSSGPLVFGSVFIWLAAMLGADPSTNPKKSVFARRFFKGVALLFMLPFIGVCFYLIAISVAQYRWLDALSLASETLVLVVAAASIAFEKHPLVQRALAIVVPNRKQES